jgi:FkbM family methyltransferase
MIPSRLKHALFGGLTFVAGDKQGMVLLPVMRGPARGLKFNLDLKTRMESAYFLGKYDSEILRQLALVCKPGWTIWDCGTYLGFYTAFFARLVGREGQVMAIEPDPFNLARTRENVARNGWTNVQFLQAAVGAGTGTSDFILSDNSNSHIPGTFVGGSEEAYYRKREAIKTVIQVPTITLDAALEEKHLPIPNLVKLDIEGAERDALNHAHRLAQTAKPIFVIELHNRECNQAAWEFAQAVDYKLEKLSTRTVIRTRSETNGTVLASPR